MAKKTFFKEKTIPQIKKLDRQVVLSPKHLVKKLLDLDPSSEYIEYRGDVKTAKQSRKNLKHGRMLNLRLPSTVQDAYKLNKIPLQYRQEAISKLENVVKQDESKAHYVGFSWIPIHGRDKRKRIVYPSSCIEGQRIDAYSQNISPIEIKPYANAKRVRREGASITATVPSREIKKPRYEGRLEHVCIDGTTERRAATWRINSTFENLWDMNFIRYTNEFGREDSDFIPFSPQTIAAYLQVTREELGKHNLTPLEMNPFAIYSKDGVDLYKRIKNNFLLFDRSLNSVDAKGKEKDQLRKPHLDEICESLIIGAALKGHDNIMYWDPARDGYLKDYDWDMK